MDSIQLCGFRCCRHNVVESVGQTSCCIFAANQLVRRDRRSRMWLAIWLAFIKNRVKQLFHGEPVDRYAVFGNPVGHSKSSLIHSWFAKQTAQALSYEAILAPVDAFADCWFSFVAAGGRGGNVTVPFKEQAYQLAELLSERALQAGAVKLLLAEVLFADHHRAHHGGMVMGADAGPFQCQLILAVEDTTACLVAAEKRIRA